MKALLADFRKTAEACRQMAELEGPEAEAELNEEDCAAVYQESLENAANLHRHLTEVTLHQLDAILDREPDDKIEQKLQEIIGLLNDGPADIKAHLNNDDDGSDDAFRQFRHEVLIWSTLFPEIGTRLEYITASLTARSSGPHVTHQTTITGSQIGGVAVGDSARAKGTASSTKSRQRR